MVLLFGGRSAEHDISCISASHVLRAIDPDRYAVVPVAIARDGRWLLVERLQGRIPRDRIPDALPVEGAEVDALAVVRGDTAEGAPPTVVLPILHGPNGEDGTVQGLLEVAGVPYVGTGVLGSAVAMDKAMAKTVLDAHGIPQPRWRAVHADDLADPVGTAERLRGALGETLFVKPANMGSSIGVSKARGVDETAAALELAMRYDRLAVVEEAVTGRELECAVLGNDSPRASTLGEIVPGSDFYDFDDKYADGVAKTIVPADVPSELIEEGRRLALRTFRALRAEGMARVDMFHEAGDARHPGRGFLVNEINTIPGFTPISMYPMLWQHSGMTYPELVDELIRLAFERHDRRAHLRVDHHAP